MTDIRLTTHPDLVVIPRAEWPRGLREQQPEQWQFALNNPSVRGCSVLVDDATAALLGSFREPSLLTDVVTSYAESSGLEPVDVLEKAAPTIERLIRAGHLRVLDGDQPAAERHPVWEPGSVIHGWEVLRCVRSIDDSAVYQVRRAERIAALKMVRRPGGWQRAALANEADVLSAARCSVVPEVLDQELDLPEPYVVLSWRPGEHCTEVADRLRRRALPGSRMDLLHLLAAVARAYADLHAAGLLHGDVQPRNVLATDGPRPQVSIVDFGFGDGPGKPDGRRFRPRGGVEGYQAPEQVRDGVTHWQGSPASEQYALGCLLYELATGAFPFDRGVGAAQFRRSLGQVPPRSFESVGARGWEDLESMLLRCLAADPASRYSGTAELAEQLEGLAGRCSRLLPPSPAAPLTEPATLVGAAEWAKLTPPLASVNFGAAGVAYAFYRRGTIRRDGLLTATALAWAEQARTLSSRPDAFHNPLLGITQQTVGSASLYHSAVGVHLVEFLVTRGCGERWTPALDRLLSAVEDQPPSADIVSGRAGLLLACAHALTALPGVRDARLGRLLAAGDALLAGLGDPLPRLDAEVPGLGQAYLGIAHGWAGVVFAVATWCRQRGRPLPVWARDLLDALVDAAEDDSRGGARWPRLAGASARGAWPGWCHGSAGHALLYCEVSRVLGPAYLRLAEAAARHASRSGARNVSLCCGVAGIVYAELALYRLTAEEQRLVEAEALLARAEAPADDPAPHSLYKGTLALRLLRDELTEPAESLMPLFEVPSPEP